MLILLEKFGAPDRIRTCDLCLRRAALYPAELRVPKQGERLAARRHLRQRNLARKPPGREISYLARRFNYDAWL